MCKIEPLMKRVTTTVVPLPFQQKKLEPICVLKMLRSLHCNISKPLGASCFWEYLNSSDHSIISYFAFMELTLALNTVRADEIKMVPEYVVVHAFAWYCTENCKKKYRKQLFYCLENCKRHFVDDEINKKICAQTEIRFHFYALK